MHCHACRCTRPIKSSGSRSGPKSLCAVEAGLPFTLAFCSPASCGILQLCSWLLLQSHPALPHTVPLGFSPGPLRQIATLLGGAAEGKAPQKCSHWWAPVESKEATSVHAFFIFVSRVCLAFWMAVTHFASWMPWALCFLLPRAKYPPYSHWQQASALFSWLQSWLANIPQMAGETKLYYGSSGKNGEWSNTMWDGWIRKRWCLHAADYSSAMRKDMVPFVTMWMDFEDHYAKWKRSQPEKDKHCMFFTYRWKLKMPANRSNTLIRQGLRSGAHGKMLVI